MKRSLLIKIGRKVLLFVITLLLLRGVWRTITKEVDNYKLEYTNCEHHADGELVCIEDSKFIVVGHDHSSELYTVKSLDSNVNSNQLKVKYKLVKKCY